MKGRVFAREWKLAVAALTAAGLAAVVLLRPGDSRPGLPMPPTVTSARALPRVSMASDRYGFVVMDTRVWIRSETDPAAVITLDDLGAPGGWAVAVSPDGRSAALWSNGGTGRNEIRLWRASSPSRVDVLLATPDGERGTGIVWAADGTGLMLSLDSLSRASAPPVDGPPDFSVLRTLDLGTGQVSDLVRMPSTSLRPLSWDRTRSVAAAVDVGGGGFTASYYLIREGKLSRTRLLMDRRHTFTVSASSDATWVAAGADIDGERRVLAWPLAEPQRVTELRPQEGRALSRVGWLGSGPELLVADIDPLDPEAATSLFVWDPSRGTRSSIIDAPLLGASSRVDASALYVRTRDGATLLLDPHTGQREVLSNPPDGWIASVVIR